MSVNKTATMFPSTIFQSLGGGGNGTNWPSEVVEIATLYEFDEHDRLFTASCDPHMGRTLRLFFIHFTIKGTQRMAFKKNALSKNKPRQNASGLAIFENVDCLITFWEI